MIACYRLVLASLIFQAALALRRCNPFAGFVRRDLGFAVVSGILLCLHFATWIASLKYISVANAVVLVATTPVFVAAGSALLLKERPSKTLTTGGLVSLIGIVTICSQGLEQGEMSMTGNLLALFGSLSFAGYLLVGRNLRSRISTLAYAGVVYTIAAALLLITTLAAGYSLLGYDPATYGLFFLLALGPQAIGHTSLNWALHQVSATSVSIIALSEPVIAPILAVFFLGEALSLIQIIGGVVVIAGVALALRAKL